MRAKFVPGEGAVERFDLGASKSNSKDDREFWLAVIRGGKSRSLLRFVRRSTRRARRRLRVCGGAEDTAVVEAVSAREEKKVITGVG